MTNEEMGEKIIKIETQLAMIIKRVDSTEKLTESVHSLALSIQSLAAKQIATEQKVDDLADEVADLEAKPVKRWDAAIAALISAIIGALVTYFLKR